MERSPEGRQGQSVRNIDGRHPMTINRSCGADRATQSCIDWALTTGFTLIDQQNTTFSRGASKETERFQERFEASLIVLQRGGACSLINKMERSPEGRQGQSVRNIERRHSMPINQSCGADQATQSHIDWAHTTGFLLID